MSTTNSSPTTPTVLHSDTMTRKRLYGRPLMAVRIVCGALIILTLSIFFAGIPARLNELRTISPSRQEMTFLQGFFPQLTPDDEAALLQLGLSVEFYAVYSIAVGVVFTIGSLITAIILGWRRSDDWMALLAALTFVTTGVAFPPVRPTAIALAKVYPVWRLPVDFVVAVGSGTIAILICVFPDGRFVPRWLRWIALAWAGWALMQVFIPEADRLGELGPIQLVLGIVVGSTVLSGLVYRYIRVSGPTQRQQTKWLLFVISALLTLFLAGNLIGFIFPSLKQPGLPGILYTLVSAPIFTVGFLLLPLGMVLAILRYRLWDVDLSINRSLVYSLVTVVLGALFFVEFLVVQAVLGIVLGGQQGTVAAAIAAAITVALFGPTRKRIQNIIDRQVYGFRFNLNELADAQKTRPITHPGILTGKTLGTYQVQGVLGKGGMGEVYLAQGNDKTVALKILPQSLAGEEDFRKRFEREAEALARLDHPNIVRIYEVGVSDDIPYMAIEFIDGQELSELIRRRGALSLGEVRSLIHDCARALDYAHQHGFVHRDIKPSNIMVRLKPDQETYEAILMDFGIAKIQDALTNITGTGAVGTIDYMAPEQIATAKAVDHRADIYALGIVLFEMLTGERPFKGSAAQVLFAHMQQPPPDPCDIRDNIPAHVGEAIRKAMAKKPEDRFQSAGETAAALM